MKFRAFSVGAGEGGSVNDAVPRFHGWKPGVKAALSRVKSQRVLWLNDVATDGEGVGAAWPRPREPRRSSADGTYDLLPGEDKTAKHFFTAH